MTVPAWMANPDRGCADADLADLFGPDETQKRLAAELCAPCPVRAECADYGRHQQYGLYGGVPESGRRRDGRRAPSQPPIALPTGVRHGSSSGYGHGCKCDECRAYKRQATRDYEARRRDRERVGAA